MKRDEPKRYRLIILRLRLCAIFLLAIAGIAGGLSKLEELPFLQIFDPTLNAKSDIQLNDLYYRLDHWGSSYPTHVTLINSGSLSHESDAFNAELRELLQTVDAERPKGVGVDLILSEKRLAEDSLWIGFRDAGMQVVFGATRSSEYSSGYRLGNVALPTAKGRTIRSYAFSGEEAGGFASLAEAIVGRPGIRSGEQVLRFLGSTRGVRALDEGAAGKLQLSQGDFAALEGSDLLKDSTGWWSEWVRNRYVIVAHLGTDSIFNPHDAEDKHRTAADASSIMFRERVTPGAVVHALAIEAMLNDEKVAIRQVPSWLRGLVLLMVAMGIVYISLFVSWGKRVNALVLGVVSIPALLVVLLLMNAGWYWPMTSSLIAFLFLAEMVEIIEPLLKKILPKTFFPE